MFRYDWYVRPPDKIPDLPWGYDVHDFYDPDAIAASAAVNSGTYDPILAEAIQIAHLMGVDLVVELNKSEFLARTKQSGSSQQHPGRPHPSGGRRP